MAATRLQELWSKLTEVPWKQEVEPLVYWQGRTGRAILFVGAMVNLVTLVACLPAHGLSQVELMVSAALALAGNQAIRRGPGAMRLVGALLMAILVLSILSGVYQGGGGFSGLAGAPIAPLLGAVLVGTWGLLLGAAAALGTLALVAVEARRGRIGLFPPGQHPELLLIMTQASMTVVLGMIMVGMQGLVRRLFTAVETKERLMNLVAHELRSGLMVVKVRSQMVRMSLERGSNPDQEMLWQVDRGVLRMERIVSDLVDAARVQSHHIDIKHERCDLRALCVNAADELADTQHREIALVVPRAETEVVVRGDTDRLHQVVTNLLGNACKYSPEGTPVSLALRIEAGRVFIEVRDQGPGIDPAHLPRIFDAFYRAPKAGGGGLGLGLYLCRELVERHDGTLRVHSTLGAGSVFTVELPLAE